MGFPTLAGGERPDEVGDVLRADEADGDAGVGQRAEDEEAAVELPGGDAVDGLPRKCVLHAGPRAFGFLM
jgi:hypothetical protein